MVSARLDRLDFFLPESGGGGRESVGDCVSMALKSIGPGVELRRADFLGFIDCGSDVAATVVVPLRMARHAASADRAPKGAYYWDLSWGQLLLGEVVVVVVVERWWMKSLEGDVVVVVRW